jgi:hypothetical protein
LSNGECATPFSTSGLGVAIFSRIVGSLAPRPGRM